MYTVSEFHAEAHRQLQVKDLHKVPTWRLERESNPLYLRLKVIDSTNAPPRPTKFHSYSSIATRKVSKSSNICPESRSHECSHCPLSKGNAGDRVKFENASRAWGRT